MQQPMNANQVQVVVVAQSGAIDKQSIYKNMKNGSARQLIGLGVVQLLIGILCIIFQGISLREFISGSFRFAIDNIGHGFWTGPLFLVTGPFGITGGIHRSRCQVVAFNVLSILSVVFASILISISVPGAVGYAIEEYYCGYNTNSVYSCYNTNTGKSETGIAMEAMMAILGLIEVIIAIWSSVICCTIGTCCCDCGGSCCCPSSDIQNQLRISGQPLPGQHQIIIATQQHSASNQQPQMFIPNQSQTFLPNSTNPQQPVFALNPQHPIINLDPRQQMAQYNPPYSQQSNVYTTLSPDRGSYTGLLRNNLASPEQCVLPGNTTSTYDEIHDYDFIVNEEH